MKELGSIRMDDGCVCAFMVQMRDVGKGLEVNDDLQ